MTTLIERNLSTLFADQDVPHEPQQARGRARREAIFEAAAVLFEEKGYGGTTTKEIAERAGMAVGTLYFYFRDKRQILLTMLASQLQQYARLGTIDRDELLRDPRAYLHRELRTAYPYNRVYYSLTVAVAELIYQDEPFRRLHTELGKLVYRQMHDIISYGQEAGLTHLGLDGEETAHALTVMVYGFYNFLPNPARVSEDDFLRRHAAASDMVYRAIFADSRGG